MLSIIITAKTISMERVSKNHKIWKHSNYEKREDPTEIWQLLSKVCERKSTTKDWKYREDTTTLLSHASLLFIIQVIVLLFSFSLLQSLVYLDTILPSINSSGDISDKYLPYHLSFFAKDSVTGHRRKHHIFGTGKQVLGDGHYFNCHINIMINRNNFRAVNGPLNLFSHINYLINWVGKKLDWVLANMYYFYLIYTYSELQTPILLINI